MNCYPFIEAEKACRRNVKRACELLKVSRAAYYAARDGKPSERERQDAELAGQIKAVHEESKGRYGAPRVHAELRRRGRRQRNESDQLRAHNDTDTELGSAESLRSEL